MNCLECSGEAINVSEMLFGLFIDYAKTTSLGSKPYSIAEPIIEASFLEFENRIECDSKLKESVFYVIDAVIQHFDEEVDCYDL